ncbi:alginate lyase family protein [Gracilibacillus salinarum]|uniref:Alginate lyase family protein n=1 Tax=Gracilibacillus salinarum TaxID=2932255 RepID=A0ABY4GRC6_9BACI|nr:alginate lyase family protein [Gracilibacillus salinarum]UOQ86922.1 alginate lyase family protein [Gracilibacillus salinarum]
MLKSDQKSNNVWSPSYMNWIMTKANKSINKRPVHITDSIADKSMGNKHDYYSNADYWWPNQDTENGLPYVKRDGESNPQVFSDHRKILRSMRTHVANLTAGYLVSGEEKYAEKAVLFLKEFFLDEETKMNAHLEYAQAIPGICEGRGIGIIDTLHLIDVPQAIQSLQQSAAMSPRIREGLKEWFSDYLHWMNTHPNGIEEKNAKNNHSVCWYVQVASFAIFTENQKMLGYCRQQYKTVLLPDQMAQDGSFPHELARTKPYSYSIFVLDNMVTLCHILSTPDQNLWEYQLKDGRGIKRGIEFLYPFLKDKKAWPYSKDIKHFASWPTRIPFLLFAGVAFNEKKYLDLWNKLELESSNLEVRRNIAIRQPVLWF